MAITIRTGPNGSYKSAYTVYFVIFEALKAGRVVVTNIEGMQKGLNSGNTFSAGVRLGR